MKKKTNKKKSSAQSSQSSKSTPRVKRASKKILSAAGHVKNATKKIVDDMFLKVVGLRVLERAQEITRSLKTEKKAVKGRR